MFIINVLLQHERDSRRFTTTTTTANYIQTTRTTTMYYYYNATYYYLSPPSAEWIIGWTLTPPDFDFENRILSKKRPFHTYIVFSI